MKIATFAAACMLIAASLAPAAADSMDPHIAVTGVGESALAPDMAELSLTVTREADTARAALDDNNAAMAEVLAAMRAGGIEERDLQTTGFSIQPRMVYPGEENRNEPPRIAGYTVSNNLTVRVRELARLGEILDRSVDLGVNQGGHIAFSHSNPVEAIDAARTAAMKDAIARADTLAAAADGERGKVISITEHSQAPGPIPLGKYESAAMRSGDAVPVAAGENVYRVMVSAVFRFED